MLPFPLTPMLSPPGLDVSLPALLDCTLSLSPERIGHHRNRSTGTVYSDDSDETIDLDFEQGDSMGFPLQRMNQTESRSELEADDEDEENQDEDTRLTALYRACMTARLENNDDAQDSSSDTSDTSSVAWDDVDFEYLVDSLPEHYTGNCHEIYVPIYHPGASIFGALTFPALSAPLSLHILNLPANPNPLKPQTNTDASSILLLLLALNTSELRSDPWNPVPRILRAVERIREDTSPSSAGSTVYLFHPPLVPLAQDSEALSPSKGSDLSEEQCTVAHWIDFFRQVLEGLTFLHENGVVWGGFDANEPIPSSGFPSEPRDSDTTNKASTNQVEMFMMDISSDPKAFTSDTTPTFDRSRYPVKYYFTNFRKARQISHSTAIADASSPLSPLTKDVQSCGHWLESLVKGIRLLRDPFLPLTRAMKSGSFTADGARKLFEARARSLSLSKDRSLWDERVPGVRWKPLAAIEESKADSDSGGAGGAGVRRPRTLTLTRSTNSDSHIVLKRPSMGASRAEALIGIGLRLPPPVSIVRSKSSPSPVPQENKRKDVFGDLNFVKNVVRRPIAGLSMPEPMPVQLHYAKESDSSTSIPPNSNLANTPSPVFTIPTFHSVSTSGLDLASQQLHISRAPQRRRRFFSSELLR